MYYVKALYGVQNLCLFLRSSLSRTPVTVIFSVLHFFVFLVLVLTLLVIFIVFARSLRTGLIIAITTAGIALDKLVLLSTQSLGPCTATISNSPAFCLVSG